MRRIFGMLALSLASLGAPDIAHAENASLDISVSYRERIALPPDAQLHVALLDMSKAGAAARQISAQRFAMISVPMSVTLPYDPAILTQDADYAVVAAIWSEDRMIYRSTGWHDPFDADEIRITVETVAQDATDAAFGQRLSGIAWTVVAIGETPWNTDDPATLAINDDGTFSLYGGCNRFTGRLLPSVSGIAFPSAMAGTMMACPDAVDALEREVLTSLAEATDYMRYGSELFLTDAAGRPLLRFEGRPE
ncbi:META domain-containing protein [Cognatishimia sp. F0-27]|uniref:META domain-containing protein n=1 Tax=Cognatishimia sp. F0-27 TaxID=2816855 RepID=UPI001D0C431D|nr:META domain-containing protein [Cognatishimia sp. F0-27]MCC1491343.1 META domain-containing protein [Cognatishimia sp. F0-27]